VVLAGSPLHNGANSARVAHDRVKEKGAGLTSAECADVINAAPTLFSVIVPVYNVAPYLARCLESLAGQTYPDFEAILVDDGSTDASGHLCDVAASCDGRFKVVHQENRGLSAARNRGIDAAHGEYLVFVDPDDYIDADALEGLARVCACAPAASERPDAVFTPHVAMRSCGGEPAFGSGTDFLRAMIDENMVSIAAWCYAVRRAFLVEAGVRFEDGILYEDLRFTPLMLMAARRVVRNPHRYYHYVRRPGSITTTPSNGMQSLLDIYDTCLVLERAFATLGPGFESASGDVLATRYLGAFKRAPLRRALPLLDHSLVQRCVNGGCHPKTRLKAALFGVSPAAFWLTANAYSFLKMRALALLGRGEWPVKTTVPR